MAYFIVRRHSVTRELYAEKAYPTREEAEEAVIQLPATTWVRIVEAEDGVHALRQAELEPEP